jgi:hypothetical protein
MDTCVVTANFGGLDKEPQQSPQCYDGDIFYKYVTEKDFPLRDKAMTARLQARLFKMFAWQFFPNHDVYLWIDSSCRLTREDSVEWFLQQLGDADIATFKHPNRETVGEEGEFLKERMKLELAGKKQKYVSLRYENEDVDGQMSEVDPNAELYATTAFVYRNTPGVQDALLKCWYHITRYHTNEQLSFPWCTKDLKVNVIHKPYMKCMYLEFTR